MHRHPTSFPHRASGIALPIVLMFMLVITVAAGFGIRRAILGEGVTRNQLDYEVARNAAEAALRDGERDLFMLAKATSAPCDRMENRPLGDAIKPPYWGSDCPNGQCYVTAPYLADIAAEATMTLVTRPARLAGDLAAFRRVAASLRTCRTTWRDLRRPISFGSGSPCPRVGTF